MGLDGMSAGGECPRLRRVLYIPGSSQRNLIQKFRDVFVSYVESEGTFPTPMGLFLLDYGAGNVQSLANTLETLGHPFKWISSPSDFDGATVSLREPYPRPHLMICLSRPGNHSLLSFPALALSRLQSMA